MQRCMRWAPTLHTPTSTPDMRPRVWLRSVPKTVTLISAQAPTLNRKMRNNPDALAASSTNSMLTTRAPTWVPSRPSLLAAEWPAQHVNARRAVSADQHTLHVKGQLLDSSGTPLVCRHCLGL